VYDFAGFTVAIVGPQNTFTAQTGSGFTGSSVIVCAQGPPASPCSHGGLMIPKEPDGWNIYPQIPQIFADHNSVKKHIKTD
jgi:hypothetical protein